MNPLRLKVFLSSPGDVRRERDLARELVKDVLPVDPFIRNKATLEIVSWDDPHASVAMPAHLPPPRGCQPRPAQTFGMPTL